MIVKNIKSKFTQVYLYMNIAFSKLYKYCLKHAANLQTNLPLYCSQNRNIRS